MSVAALFLAAATVHAPTADTQQQDRGAQVDTARVSATILRPAVVTGGVLLSGSKTDAPHSQRQAGNGQVNYIFE